VGDAAEYEEMRLLSEQYPGDVGVLAPLLLNLVQLAPGQALFLDAGNLHAYLRGVGIELMANSDNVLRAGLTTKHIDVPELLATLRFEAGVPERLRPGPAGVYRSAAAFFELAVWRVSAGQPWHTPDGHSVEILFCSEGRVRVAALSTDATDSTDSLDATDVALELVPGQALFVPAAAGAYRIAGEGVVYRAGVPR
jgi:mannose-6-phosphate isomerase